MSDINKKNILRKILSFRELIVFVIIIIFFIFLIFLTPNFLTTENMLALLLSVSINSIVAIGMTILLISGGFDLSVGSVLGWGGVITGMLLLKGIPIVFSIIIGLSTCAFIGLLNALIIVKMKVNSLITTLGMLNVVRGAIFIFTKGHGIPDLPANFNVIGQKTFFNLQTPIIIMLIFVIIFDIFIRNSAFFRQFYYIGSNENTAVLSGIKTDILKMLGYILSALLAGLAGIILAARSGGAMALAGTGLELRVITACIIGGCSLAGGEGTILGAFLGIFLIATVINAFNLLGVSVYWQDAILGLILILAVIFDVVRKRFER